MGNPSAPFDGEVYMSKDIGVSISELPREQDDMKAHPNWVKSEMVITIAQDVKGYWFESSLAHNNFKHNQYGVSILHYCNFHKSIYESFKKFDDN